MGSVVFEFQKVCFNEFCIRWYSLLILTGVLIGISLLIREGRRFDISSEFLFNMAFWAIVFGLIGARIYYVIFNFSAYAKDPISILKVWEGGLAIHGGIIGGLLTIMIYCKKYGVSLIRILDLCVVPLILAQAIGRWGNFFNMEAHGASTTLAHLQSLHIPQFIIKGMTIGGVVYQPTFLYESLLCFLGFIILVIVRRYRYLKVGIPTSIYLMYYGAVRFFIESMRTDSLMFGGIKMAQLVSVIMFIIGIIYILSQSKKGKFESLYNDQYGKEIKF